MLAYYNEIDPYAAQWLRNLIEAGHIAPGVVDERSIEDVHPSDLRGFTQCHFFAGVGVWSLALRRAGWPDDRPVLTGSCPCQPFSAAGAGAGFADARHLWPTFAWLIKQCKPAVVFGEQVASKAVEPWVDLVHADVEAMGYAFGAIPFPSAGVGAPHIRDRLYWVADASSQRLNGGRTSLARNGRNAPRLEPERLRNVVGLADTDGGDSGAERQQRSGQQRQQPQDSGGRELVGLGNTEGVRREGECLRAGPGLPEGGATQASGISGLADTQGSGRREECQIAGGKPVGDNQEGGSSGLEHGSSDLLPGPVNGFWRVADWLGCRDGKWRPVRSGSFPLVARPTEGMVRMRADQGHRAGRLRAYGNAINAEAAREFISTYMDARP